MLPELLHRPLSSRLAPLVVPLVGCWLGALLLAGCSGGGSAPGASTGANSAPGGGPASTAAPAGGGSPGAQVYVAHNCANCHALNGQGGRQGPDLSHAGASHDAQWLAAHVRNPKTHNPGSRMPAFQDKIADADLTALGEYLASLK